jgi:3-deoxy-7-phosphoheptulonate synthase
MIDCSHGNSGKSHEHQMRVAEDIATQLESGDRAIAAAMVESHLVAGRQDLVPGRPLDYGRSVTDGCIGWDDTERVLDRLASAVRARRGRRVLAEEGMIPWSSS